MCRVKALLISSMDTPASSFVECVNGACAPNYDSTSITITRLAISIMAAAILVTALVFWFVRRHMQQLANAADMRGPGDA
jgi:hypothetical protein